LLHSLNRRSLLYTRGDPKGLAKNEAQLFSLFGLANIVIAKRRLLDIQARGAY